MSGVRPILLLVAIGLVNPAVVGQMRAAAVDEQRPIALLEKNGGTDDLNKIDAGSAEANGGEPAKPAAKGNPLWAIPLRMLSATRERPLFSPSRRPPAPVVAAAPVAPPAAPAIMPGAPERPPMILVGTIVGENEKVAIFFNPATRAVTRVREGDQESGWLVRSVGQRAIVVEKDNQIVTLDLPKRSDGAPGNIGPGAAPQSAGDNL